MTMNNSSLTEKVAGTSMGQQTKNAQVTFMEEDQDYESAAGAGPDARPKAVDSKGPIKISQIEFEAAYSLKQFLLSLF